MPEIHNNAVAGRLLFTDPETGGRMSLYCEPSETEDEIIVVAISEGGKMYARTITTEVLEMDK